VFDVMGTVVDDVGGVRATTVAALGRRGDTEQAALQVAASTGTRLKDLMTRVSAGERPWASHRDLRREAVRAAVAEAGLAAPDEATEAALTDVVETFEPWPDSAAGLDRLRADRLVVALTNADLAEIATFSLRGGLAWHLALSTSASRTFKPDPRAYGVAIDALGISPDQIMMVASHPWDLRGGAALGLRTCCVRRPGEEPPPEDEFDLVVDDLLELADELGTPA
jgi:2-haloacid dehalogenase